MTGATATGSPDWSFRRLVLLGAAVRVAYWLSKWNTPLGFNDSLYYSAQARQLARGILFEEITSGHPGAEHGPLTPILMAPLSFMEDSTRWQRLPTMVCGIVLVWLLGRLAGRLAGRRAALTTTAIAALTPTLWLSDGLVMSESIAMLCVATVLWFALDAADRPTRRSMIALGVALGLASLARSELVLLIPGVAAWLVIGRLRRGERPRQALTRIALPVLVTAGLVLAPWVGFNLARFERPVLLSTNDGTTLLGANCDDSYSAVGPGAGGWSLLCLLDDPDDRPGEEPSVRSERQRRLAFEYIRENLPGVPRVLAARVLRTLDLYGLRDQIRGDVGEERLEWAAWVGVPAFWLMALALPFGLKRLTRRDRWLLLLPVALVIFTSVVFYGSHRIRSPAEPSIVLLAGIAVASLIDRRSGADVAQHD